MEIPPCFAWLGNTGKPRDLAGRVRLSLLCGKIKIPCGYRRRRCGETGAQTRTTFAKDDYWDKNAVAGGREYRGSYFGRTLGNQMLVARVSRRDALSSLMLLLLFSPSSLCLRACFSTTPVPAIHM